eukprot:TRINITY_DN23887_c0_g1_i3.p1 TRINITY_DN23887_c0_g1~~TRINITY_DN23887_c0_g1_i3.p1  ORF type:complete len:475 (-),score=37.79 TRINITY_DN23887_c0_g1_i3:69-1493(-)
MVRELRSGQADAGSSQMLPLTGCARWLAWTFLCSRIAPSVALYDEENGIQAARLYGNIDSLAYYYVDVLVGTPPQRVSAIVDTGSALFAFPCTGCDHCGKHIDPAFDIGGSSTAQWAKCGLGCRNVCKYGYCSYQQGYTEGSSIKGYYFDDFVRLGDSIQHNPPVKARLGCHYNENRLFYTQKANGILGIGPKGTTLLSKLFTDTEHVKTAAFALCLAEWGGRLVVGGQNQSYHTGTTRFISLNTNSGFYGIKLKGIQVDGKDLKVTLNKGILDSGTTYTYLPSAAYTALKAAIESYCERNNSCGASRVGVCWKLPARQDPYEAGAGLALFPTVHIQFGEATIPWSPTGYLFRKGAPNNWCYGFENDGPKASTTLGASFMIHNEVFFDLRRGRVGITPAICPEYRDRPYHKGLPMIFRPGSMLRTENMVGISVLIVSFGVGIIIWRRCGCCCRQSLASSMDDTFKQGRTLHTIS